MEKNKNNEEVQSRREFFKNAAKSALPILGAVVLSGIALPSQAAKMSCDGTCSGSCTSRCSGCTGSCSGGCSGCSGSCSGTSTSSY